LEQAVRNWDRASFELNTRPVRRPRAIRQRDLLLPAHHDRLHLFAACVACGICGSILYVWITFTFVLMVVNRPIGAWIWLVVAVAAAISSVVLFAAASRQMEKYREYASEI
jgi:hypothetical protein